MARQIAVDLIGLAGLVLVGYGLHQWRPWLAFTVVGALLILFACTASTASKSR